MGFIRKRGLRRESFIGERRDGSLESLLSEAFACLEHCFNGMDGDNAGMIMYTAFVNQLALRGFHDTQALDLVWKHVDLDQSGSLDFSEFLSLMFLWAEVCSSHTVHPWRSHLLAHPSRACLVSHLPPASHAVAVDLATKAASRNTRGHVIGFVSGSIAEHDPPAGHAACGEPPFSRCRLCRAFAVFVCAGVRQ